MASGQHIDSKQGPETEKVVYAVLSRVSTILSFKKEIAGRPQGAAIFLPHLGVKTRSRDI